MTSRQQERKLFEDVVQACPDYFYTAVPSKTETRYVFRDRVCLTLTEAYDYARYLNAVREK